MANAALWLGAVLGVAGEWGDVADRMEFHEARGNFLAAARQGLRATLAWPGRDAMPAPGLILEEILPLARSGLVAAGVESGIVARCLGIIEARVSSGRTGSVWLLDSLRRMGSEGSRDERMAALTAATARRQEEGGPVHEWPVAERPGGEGMGESYRRVEQYMSTDLVTVHEDEQAEMVAWLMEQKGIRHVLVEDGDHRLVGLVSYRTLLRFLVGGREKPPEECPVSEIMERSPRTVSPGTQTLEAIRLLRTHGLSCLPVLSEGKLVGVVSDRDFLPAAYRLLEEHLEGDGVSMAPSASGGGADPEKLEGGFILDATLEGDTLPVCRLPLCTVLLMDDARYPWLILVPRRAGLVEIHDLAASDRTRLWEEIQACSRAMGEHPGVEKVNTGALGNVVSQLHVHVVGRRSGDDAWPGPVWGRHPPLRLGGEEGASRVEAFRRRLQNSVAEVEGLPSERVPTSPSG